ncbi:MAG: hypothetical protein Q9226_008671 [Calogaya cf. arnoldii]
MSSYEMADLAEIIHTNTSIVNRYYSDRNLAPPSFRVTSPSTTVISDEKAATARWTVLAAMHELRCLMLGPAEALMSVGCEDMVCLQTIYRYKIDQKLGIDETLPFETLSARSGLNFIDLRRILRYAMTNFVFREPQSGFVAHTSLSIALAQDTRLRNFVGIACEERFPASARTVDALELYGHPKSQNQSGFALSQNTDKGLYDELRQHPERERRWTSAMDVIASQKDFDFVIDSLDWLRSSTGTIVDVGGGSGLISEGLALRLPGLHFVVQDSENVVQQAGVHTDVKDRISFMTHNFFDEQPVKHAEVYYFRNIFHDWPDEQGITILRNLIPALKPGAHVIIDNFGLQEPRTLPAYQERVQRAYDIMFLTYFGSRERSVDDWRILLNKAHPGFKIRGSKAAPSQVNVVIDIIWEGAVANELRDGKNSS